MASGSLPHSLHIHDTSATNGGQSFAGVNLGTIKYVNSNNNNLYLNEVLNSLPTAKDAPFSAHQRQHDPTCLPDTRVNLLQKIYDWADGDNSPNIFWLSGLAGTGKSTVARTLVAKYAKTSGIAASFFFSRDGGEGGHLRHAGRFVTSIAVQLANNVQPLKRTICDAISADSDIAHRALREQWRYLILGPLSKLGGGNGASRYLLVVDALDECEDEDEIRTILQLLAEARSLETVRLRVFLTSRPEVPIRHGLIGMPDAEHQEFVLHNISPAIVDHDIHTFLIHSLRLIAQERSLASGWPGEQVVQSLVQSASGLFIWAATACRFIREGKRFAAKRLDMILEHSSTAITAPEKRLHEIYTTVLRHCISPDYSDDESEELRCMLKNLLGSIVTLLSPLSTQCLSKLLGIAQDDVHQTLDDLHAIVDIPKEPSVPLRLHHPSFRDFLLDERRCGDSKFWVDEKQAHRTLATKCIELMCDSLKQDILDVDQPGALVAEVESRRIEQHLPPEVQYACLYWTQHFRRSGFELNDGEGVHRFLQKHFLHWLEALGWMGKVREGIHAIISLESMTMSHGYLELSEFVHDMKRFIMYSRSAIEQAPLQTYCSALVFAPEASIVKRQFRKCAFRWLQRLPKVDKDWNVLLQTLEGHSNRVYAVTFWPNDKVLASASDDNTVKLWDADSGTALQTLDDLPCMVDAVAFSPDGKVLALASVDRTVKLWDTHSKTVLQTLECDPIDMAFSPEGKVLVSVSYDHKVQFWETDTGVMKQPLKGCSGCVTTVAFSPDGKLLASALDDYTIQMWDANSGAMLHTLKGHHANRVNAVAFSPDGKMLASASSDSTIKLWNTGEGAALQTLKSHTGDVSAIAFSPSGKVLASASYDMTVRLWDAGTGMMLRTLERHSNSIKAIVFSQDGEMLASASSDKTVKLWSTGTGVVLQKMDDHSDYVNAVAFSPDRRVLASASRDKTVKIWDVWDVDTRVLQRTIKGHSGVVTTVAFSPDGKILASASDDYAIQMWDTDSGAMLRKLKGHHSDWVNAVAFSSDGKILASASDDHTIQMWDAYSGAILHILRDHQSGVSAVAFSPNGKTLWSASDDNTVKLWDAGSGKKLQTLTVDSDIRSFSFSDAGSCLWTDRGVLLTTELSNHAVLPQPASLASMFIKEEWIYWNGKRVVWLPSEYRSSVFVVCGSVVGFGFSSGRVLVLRFVF